MKIAIELDATPEELRETLGLPNVSEVQKKWVKAVDAKMTEKLSELSPEAILENWMQHATPSTEMFSNFMNLAGLQGGTKKV